MAVATSNIIPVEAPNSDDDEEKQPDRDHQTHSDDDTESHRAMVHGLLPLGAFYEDLDFVHLSRYRHGIPSGLEGLKRRLIEEDGLKYEGIFRLRGKDSLLETAKQLLTARTPISKVAATPIEVAQIMKAFYRNIPCDAPGHLSEALLTATTESEVVEGFAALSEPRKSLLLWTFDLWIEIEGMTLFNKMTLQSMSIVFSPNMVRTERRDQNDPMVFLELQKKVQRVILIAAKLRRDRRLILDDGAATATEDDVVPFKRDRLSLEEPPEMQYPAVGGGVNVDDASSAIADFFKNCVVL